MDKDLEVQHAACNMSQPHEAGKGLSLRKATQQLGANATACAASGLCSSRVQHEESMNKVE